jgi:hypothetical protein
MVEELKVGTRSCDINVKCKSKAGRPKKKRTQCIGQFVDHSPLNKNRSTNNKNNYCSVCYHVEKVKITNHNITVVSNNSLKYVSRGLCVCCHFLMVEFNIMRDELLDLSYGNRDEVTKAVKVLIARSNLRNGNHGLYALSKFLIGEIITEYDGTITEYDSDNESKYRIGVEYKYNKVDGKRVQVTSKVIDGDPSITTKNLLKLAAYANDARPNNEHNNAKFVNCNDNGYKVLLVATKEIEEFDEIFVSYGERYFDEEKKK